MNDVNVDNTSTTAQMANVQTGGQVGRRCSVTLGIISDDRSTFPHIGWMR